MVGGAAFQVGAVMRLVDMISGPLKMIKMSMEATGRGAATLSAKAAGLARAMMPVAAVAGLVLGALGGTAMATVETGRALGELASVGVRDMAALEQAAQDFSNTWAGTTKPQFISAAYDIKSGISSLTDHGVAEFTKLAALTGKATKSTTAEMTSLFATGYGIYKKAYGDLSDMEFGELFSAGIAASVQSFKTTGSGMAQAISQLGAAATTAKVPLEEQLTILGMLQATMSGSEAGTKYKAVMQSAAGAGQKLGLSFMDANNQLLSMPDILATLQGKYGSTLDAMEKMEIQKAFGTQEAVAVIDLLYDKTGDLAANIHGLSGAMQMGQSFTARMAATMNQDLGAVLRYTGQQFHNLLEIVGKMFVPVILWVTSGVSALIMALQRLAANPAGRVILGLVGTAAAAALAVTGLALAVAGVSALIPVVTGALAPLLGALAALSWPVWAAVAAVAALYVAYRSNFGGMADVVGAFFGNLSLVFRAVREIFATLRGDTGAISGDLAKQLEAAGLLGLVTVVAKVAHRVGGFLAELWGGFAFVAGSIGDVFTPVLDSLTFAFQPLFEIIRAVAGALFGTVAATDAGPWRILGAVVGVVLGSAFKVLAWAVRIAIVPLEVVVRAIGAVLWLVVGLGRAIGNVAGWLAQAFSGLGEINLFASGAKLIDTLVAGIKSKIMAPVEAVKAGFSKLRDLLPFSDAKEGPLSELTLSGRRIMDTLGAGVTGAAPSLRKTMASALAGAALTTSVAVAPAGAQEAALGQSAGIGQQRQVPPPMVASADDALVAAKPRAGGGRGDGERSVSIRIDNLTLPGVSNPDEFIKKLQQLVEAHDA